MSIIATLHNACTAQTTIATPLGPVLIARTEVGLAGLWFEGQKHHPGTLTAPQHPTDPMLQQIAHQLQAYWLGQSCRFTVPLDLRGTVFQRAVWHSLLAIAPGHTRSYGQIARSLGASSSVRAVGNAVGRNPVSVIVPCHRVLGSDGSLTGYAGGLDRKRSLLLIERGAVPIGSTAGVRSGLAEMFETELL
jgi:methylated-DNA-[protein]-cysteine S-methyltransferase